MRAVVISLKDSKRRPFLRENFGDVEVFDGVNGTSEIEEFEDEVVVRGGLRIPLDRAFSQSIRGRQLGRGQMGCALSHYLLWKALAESDEAAYLIMEDDARVQRPQFEQAMQQLPAPADVVYLHDHDLRFNQAPREHSRYNQLFYRTTGGVAHTHGYIISREHAARIVSGFKLAHAADGALGRSFRDEPERRVYYMYEPCIRLTSLAQRSESWLKT